jgi:hypothetical protein
MLSSKKRGESDVQFNWIFVLAAAAVFLFIIFRVISAQRSSAELSYSVTLRARLDSAVAASLSQDEFSGEISLGKSGINFSCGKALFPKIAPSDLGAEFSPKQISADATSLIIKSEQWYFPMKAGSLIYLTSPKNSYLFVKNPDFNYLIDEIYAKMPDAADKVLIENLSDLESEIKNRPEKNVRVITFNEQPAGKILSSPASFISFYPASGSSIDYGAAEFYNKKTAIFEKTLYLGKEMLVAALYAETIDDYECSAKKAFDRLYWILDVSKSRLQKMSADYPDKSTCRTILSSADSDSAQGSISEFMSLVSALKNSEKIPFDIGAQIDSSIADLNSKNIRLVRFSCSSIY